MSNHGVHGLIVPLLTPLDASLNIDRMALKVHTARLLNKGVENFFTLSHYGEQAHLKKGQEAEFLSAVADSLNGKATILAGCFASTAEDIITKVRFVERFTNECVVNVPLSALSNDMLFMDFFEELFMHTSANIFIYNNPYVNKKAMPLFGFEKIANWEKLVGVIEGSRNFEYSRALHHYNPDIALFQEHEELAMDSLRARFSGVSPLLANAFPQYFLELLEGFEKLDYNAMVREQNNITSLLQDYFPAEKRIQATKYLLSLQGIGEAHTTVGLARLTELETLRLEKLYNTVHA